VGNRWAKYPFQPSSSQVKVGVSNSQDFPNVKTFALAVSGVLSRERTDRSDFSLEMRRNNAISNCQADRNDPLCRR